MDSLEHYMEKRLAERKARGNLRTLQPSGQKEDFVSNDYLGLARSPDLQQKVRDVYEDVGLPLNGATGSRLLSGNSSLAMELEDRLAGLFKTESALLFNSGYVANLAILSALPQKNDTIIYDSLSHACIKEGARLSLAQHFSFKHNNLEDLEKKLQKATGHIFIVVESLYSMDGDQCPLYGLIRLSQKYQAALIIDEAHSTGIMGKEGSGMVCRENMESCVFARIHTFGKAMGAHGACIVGSSTLKQFLVNFARSFIYTTALPAHSLVSIAEGFNYLSNNMELQETLTHKINLFKKDCLQYLGSSNFVNEGPIQAIIIPGNEKVKYAAKSLNEEGYDVRPILSPTVAAEKERLRICIHTFNEDIQISRLIRLLAKVKTEN